MRRFLNKLRYVHARDIASVFLFLLAVPYARRLKKKRPHLWLICERRMEACDNGFWLYRYIRTEQPHIDAVYAIDSSSPEASKVLALGGEVVEWGGIRHWAYYLAAEYNISSQKDGKPNAALCYVLEVYGLRKNRRVFLQHGVVHNDNEFLHYENTKMGLFVCGAKPEYDYVRKAFGYPQGAVRYLGLARFDGLYDFKIEKIVLIIPTWRKVIATPARFSPRLDTKQNFERTAYYQNWRALLCNTRLTNCLASFGMRVVFYPHPDMNRFLDEFRQGCSGVEFCDRQTCDMQDLLRRAAFLVTDYSSVAMDFAYMGKPLLYFQFDMDDFRANQYKPGYFDYARDGFGPVCKTPDEVMDVLLRWAQRAEGAQCVDGWHDGGWCDGGQYVEGGRHAGDWHAGDWLDASGGDWCAANDERYLARSRAFFELHDRHNCQRNFEAIRDWREQ